MRPSKSPKLPAAALGHSPPHKRGGGRNRLGLWKCTPMRGLAVLALLLLAFYAALHMHISAIMSNSHMALNQVHDRPVKSKATVRKKLDASHRLQQDDGKEKKITLQHTHHQDTARKQYVKQEKNILPENINNAGTIRPKGDSKNSNRVVDVPSKTNDPQSNNEGSKPSGILDVFINVKQVKYQSCCWPTIVQSNYKKPLNPC